MTYIRTSKRPGTDLVKMISIVCGAIVIVIIAVQLLVPYFLPALFTTIARPFWRMEFSAASGSLDSPQALLVQNEDLKNQLTALEVSQQSIHMLQSDNSALLALLGRSTATSTGMASLNNSSATSSSPESVFSSLKPLPGLTLAAVLVRPPVAPYDELVIDIGADHDLVTGAKVYAPGNVLIGTTTDILGQTSKVKLFSSPGEAYPVLIGPGHIPATAIGRGGGQYEAQIPQASKVNQGDFVSDSSLSSAPFGIVSAVISNPAEPFEMVLFAPPVNIYQLRWVLVDTSNNIAVKALPPKAAKGQKN
jgi:cell shape-determining protein MreC